MPYTQEAVRSFYRASRFVNTTLSQQGIRPIFVNYPWGNQLRFAIKGSAGLYGINSVNELLIALGFGEPGTPPIPDELEGYIEGLARTEIDITSISSIQDLQTKLEGQLLG